MKVLIAGGGTGGHIYPGLAIARSLEENFSDLELLFVGTKQGLEADIIPKEGYELKTISVEGLPRKVSIKLFKSLFKSTKALIESKRIIKEFKADIVIGTGGYVCGPVVLAAALDNIPTLIHEQNAYPGITNKLLSRFVDRVALSNIDAKKYFSNPAKITLTGNPIRPEILEKSREEGFKELNLRADKKIILVFGGSRGAKSINQAVVNLYGRIEQLDCQLLHITGKRDFAAIKEQAKKKGIKDLEKGKIIIKPYLYNMSAALAVSSIVISRAGATGLAEITACGIPAILIPYPYAAEDHQLHNARSLERKGAAKVILDNEITADLLYQNIKSILSNKSELTKMSAASRSLGRPEAIKNILKIIEDLVVR